MTSQVLRDIGIQKLWEREGRGVREEGGKRGSCEAEQLSVAGTEGKEPVGGRRRGEEGK